MSESIAGVVIPDSQLANETTDFIRDADRHCCTTTPDERFCSGCSTDSSAASRPTRSCFTSERCSMTSAW